MIDYLTEYSNAKVIGLDALIPSLDKDNPASDIKFFNSVAKANNLVVGFNAQRNVVFNEERQNAYNEKFKNKFHNIDVELKIPQYYSNYIGILEYPEPYFNAAKYAGAVNVTQNDNGYLTHMNQLVSVNGEYYPSLGLQMYMYVNKAKDIVLLPYGIYIKDTDLFIQANPTIHGIQNNIRFYRQIPNSDGYSHKKYSASDIIRSYDLIKQGKKPIIDPKEFDGKAVFVGANAKAAALSLEDALPTPLNPKHPGTDIQATNFDNLMRGDFVNDPSLFDVIILPSIMVILTLILIYKFSFFVSLISIVLITAGYTLFAIICYKNGYAALLATPIATQVVSSVFGYSYKYILEGRNKEKIKQAMGKYLSQDVMQNVVKNIDNVKLGGKRANVTVLFSDIRGFTSMSEKLLPEEVSNILNEYFTEIEPIITKHNGVINKFIGDAVMAIFGEPIQDLNHPVNAVKCAYDMLKKVEELQEKWIFEGKPKIEIGIGINTGDAFVGNIGSEQRLEYTVIGDTVNLASRIEGYNKVYHTNLLVSSSTYKYISDIADVIKISEVSIRGKSKKMDIYEVLRINDKS